MRLVISVAICVIVSLVLGAVATRYIHPHWIFATLHSLQLHAVAACVAAMILALLVRRHFLVWLLFAASLLFAGHTVLMNREFAAPMTAADEGAPVFRLLSFNTLNDNYENTEGIVRAIVSSGADLVNIMEAAPLRIHMDELAKTYPYRVGCDVLIRNCDQVMLSKVPIVAPVVRSLSDIFPARFILATVTVAGRTISFAGIHTTKPYFDNFHSLELSRAALALSERPGPLLLSGDFNASSLAPNMRRFLRITGLKTYEWEPATWPIRAGAFGVPIDHVYVREPLKIKSLTRLPDALGSNHFALLAEIAITGP
ncbi:endonuclease/exonuclease/phosphatase family protein [Rhizobium terrae]|uniref:endonuclease/exonuclease/phosphatase family protein n=1 Tax=Rhizobium terrae TaxID=2171756 RepID=UPI0013C31166|nr:endonuclease/exonuclease/phosphatase family protein [Rhizobium terrae]